MSLVSGRVLITGATGGIGEAIARAFAARGAELILTGRRPDVLERIASEVRARPVVCDLSQRDEVDRLVQDAGALDVLVSNAALPGSGELSELGQDEIDRMLEVNLRAPVALAHGVLPGMLARRRGHLVFVSSLSGKAASRGASIYSATKFGLRGFALALRQDLAREGLGVSTVAPGFIREAGMFAEAGVRLPPWVSTRSVDDVARAVIRAVEENRAEIDVAALSLRVGASIAGVAPEISATVSRWLGGERVAQEHIEGQRNKRQ